MCVVMFTLICKMEDLGELESLLVSAVSWLNDYGILIGWEKSSGQGQVD